MKLVVKQGTVRADKIYGVGDMFEIGEKQGNQLLRVGVVEKYVEKVEEPVEKKKKIVKEKIVEKPVEEVIEPTIDWTRKELNEYAEKVGVEDVDKLPNKDSILQAINDKT
jgi:hypothetical protein